MIVYQTLRVLRETIMLDPSIVVSSHLFHYLPYVTQSYLPFTLTSALLLPSAHLVVRASLPGQGWCSDVSTCCTEPPVSIFLPASAPL